MKSLAPGYIIRPLAPTDYEKGLAFAFTMIKARRLLGGFERVDNDLKKERIVGAGTIFVERKFVHKNGLEYEMAWYIKENEKAKL
ncbi:hypothetical protein HDU96_003998 [Phlyctochytrium bullatum]|nr:hypothetical protein HDU96_003998 [Phlyctochytrium bullatum]